MRIASLSPALTEILFELDLGRDIVAVDQYSDYPDEAKKLPHLRGHTKVDLEELRTYEPEIVLTQTLIQEELSSKLQEARFAVRHFDPRSLKEIYDTILDLGAFFEKLRSARELIQKMHSGFSAVQKKAALLPRRPTSPQGSAATRARIYIEEWHNPPMVSGNWVPEVAKIAGGETFPLPARAPSREVTLEEIQQFNPDLIVLSICGASGFAERNLLTSREGWSALEAVKLSHLFVIDDSLLNRPGPRLVEGAQQLYGFIFQALH